MLKKLRRRLRRIATALIGKERSLGIAQHRWEMNHVRAVANHRAGKEADREAAKAKRLGHPKRQKAAELKAARCHHRAFRAKRRADFWIGQVKTLTSEVHDLAETKEQLEARIRKLIEESGCKVDIPGNRVTGGADKQRVGVAMHVSASHAREYYSQEGTFSTKFCLTGPPTTSYRYDCSSWFASVYDCCGLPDPSGENFQAGWTATLAEHGHRIRESDLDTGDAILYGYAPFFHVEMKDGPMSRSPYTIGHGSAPVDRGIVALVPGPRQCRRYL